MIESLTFSFILATSRSGLELDLKQILVERPSWHLFSGSCVCFYSATNYASIFYIPPHLMPALDLSLGRACVSIVRPTLESPDRAHEINVENVDNGRRGLAIMNTWSSG